MIQNDLMNPELLHAIQNPETDEILEHFGVKGMKWGFRKFRSNRRQQAERRKASKKASATWTKKYHNRHVMTSKDLREATNRLRLENDFAEQVKRSKQLGGNNKPFGNKVKKAAAVVGTTVAGAALKTFTNDIMKNKPENYSAFTKQVMAIGNKLKK